MIHQKQLPRCYSTVFDEIECVIPFHRALIDRWKDAIPPRFRSYDQQTKVWRFWGGYKELATALLLECFPDADVPGPTRERARPRTSAAGSDHYAALHLLPSAPHEVIDAAYRALAKLHHPDLGGEPTIMRRLTEAHEALSRRLTA